MTSIALSRGGATSIALGLLTTVTTVYYVFNTVKRTNVSIMNRPSGHETCDADDTMIKAIEENFRMIRSVLNFWFGQYEPDKSQKKLWMIAASSKDFRNHVDQEIARKFQDVLQNKKLLNEWKTNSIYGYEGKIASIVVLDQFSRHIHRYYSSSSNTCPISPQKELDNLAYDTAQSFVKDHQKEIHYGMIALPMIIFSLMPFRHTNTLKSVEFVQETVEKLASMEIQCDAMLRRFRKATNRRMALLQDQARREGDANGNHNFLDLDILETTPFSANMVPSKEHIVHQTIVNFLKEHLDKTANNHKNGAKVNECNHDEMPSFPVIISLSGGVDSMVIASVLAYVASSCDDYNIKVYGIHIDYANRPESGAEASYVEQYCKKQNITFFLRRITEVTRGITARDDYERIAREARYHSYRETVQKCQEDYKCAMNNSNREDVNIPNSFPVVGVMLGHHRGDLRENVLSNSHKGCGPLDLSGMTAVSKNDGVIIQRPLLALEKKAIYEYAHAFGVPYFKDTTPHWSTRGKIRNKLLPLLQEIYGEGSMINLSKLATESDEARSLLYQTVLGPFLDQVEVKKMGIMFETQPWKEQRLFFWKFVLRETLHKKANLGMFSDKSVQCFVERITAKKMREGWLQCRRDYAVYLRQDGKVFILFPDRFPFRKSDQFKCPPPSKAVTYGKVIKVGPWMISATIVTDAVDHSTLLSQKAISSWECFLDGCVEYYVKVPLEEGIPRPLRFISSYDKTSRPEAWKQTDLKLQTTLPLLGNDSDGIFQLRNGENHSVVIAKILLRVCQNH